MVREAWGGVGLARGEVVRLCLLVNGGGVRDCLLREGMEEVVEVAVGMGGVEDEEDTECSIVPCAVRGYGLTMRLTEQRHAKLAPLRIDKSNSKKKLQTTKVEWLRSLIKVLA